VAATDYDIFIFVGGDGAKEFYHHENLLRLIRDVITEQRPIILIG
jgi:putative intracellular protease/amidase